LNWKKAALLVPRESGLKPDKETFLLDLDWDCAGTGNLATESFFVWLLYFKRAVDLDEGTELRVMILDKDPGLSQRYAGLGS